MGRYVAENIIKSLIKADIPVKHARVGILGFTFKENCPDTRNTKIIDIVNELKEYGINPMISDPVADAEEAKILYGVELISENQMKQLDALILAVAHDIFTTMNLEKIEKMIKKEKVIIDIKGIYDRKIFEQAGYIYWRL